MLWLVLVVVFLGQPAGRVSAASADQTPEQLKSLLSGQWSAQKLYAVLNSPNPEEQERLYREAFAAGPSIIPKLDNALKDDRTAEFAAQTLAYLGGGRALEILAKLVDDPRNLDLRRFYYGALGGSNDAEHIKILLNKVRTSDREPDRTVTRDAILALSISTDPGLVPKLRQIEDEVTDPVVQDDINTAATVIELRAKYLASPAGKKSGSSVAQAIRTYFMPALEGPPDAGGQGQKGSAVDIHIKDNLITFSPDKTRALAAVDFEDPQAVAYYHVVLQKRQDGWTVASVWLGQEAEKHPQPSKPGESQ